MKFQEYITEKIDLTKIKKEIKELQAYKKAGKLTVRGQKRLEKLEDKMFKMGIFDF